MISQSGEHNTTEGKYCACRTAYTTHLRRKCCRYHQEMLVLKGPPSFKAHTETSHTTSLSGKDLFFSCFLKVKDRTSEHHCHVNKDKLQNSLNYYRVSRYTHLLHKQNQTKVSSLPVLKTIGLSSVFPAVMHSLAGSPLRLMIFAKPLEREEKMPWMK